MSPNTHHMYTNDPQRPYRRRGHDRHPRWAIIGLAIMAAISAIYHLINWLLS